MYHDAVAEVSCHQCCHQTNWTTW